MWIRVNAPPHTGRVTVPFPEPTTPTASRTETLLWYIDYLRARVVSKIEGLPDTELRRSRLPSGWTPIELLKHLTFVEMRWLEWRFGGHEVADPWGDQRDGNWHVADGESVEELLATLNAQAGRSRLVIETTDLARAGQPGPGWDGAGPATFERVLLHLIQEYARHLGHLDIVTELAGGPVGE